MPRRVLLADDSETVRGALRTCLRAAPEYEICGEAVDGVQAIEMAKELQPDVILLDLIMPRLNGAVAASVLRREFPKTPIVLFSFFHDGLNRPLAKALGVDAVISKPDAMTALADCLNRIFHPEFVPALQSDSKAEPSTSTA